MRLPHFILIGILIGTGKCARSGTMAGEYGPPLEMYHEAGCGHLVIDDRKDDGATRALRCDAQSTNWAKGHASVPTFDLVQISVPERDKRAHLMSTIHCSIERDDDSVAWLVKEKDCRNWV